MSRKQTKPGEYPCLFAFRTTPQLGELLNLCIGSFPGKKAGVALREFFELPEVERVIRNRAEAEAARQVVADLEVLLSADAGPPD